MDKKNYSFQEVQQKMAAYCSYQDRCHSEVEQKMKEFFLIPEARDEILLFLIRENFLNEERFTRSYIRGKFYIKNWGRNKIRQSLRQKMVEDKLISKCMDEIEGRDYINVLKKLYENYYSKCTAPNEYQKKQKTIRYLLNRGFEYETIIHLFHED